jgi:EAL domain-containing protein (putative c-di-GMP-specific phosphodiesterase class I)
MWLLHLASAVPTSRTRPTHNAESATIVRAIITMAKCLGMSTTVEGVETSEQFDFSVAAGCDTIQGYLISRPLYRADLRTSWRR